MDLDFFASFKDCVQKIDKIGNEYANGKADSWHKQEMTGSVKSSIMKSLGDIPVSRAEIEAKTHPDYLKHLEETREAIRLELQLKARYEAQKARFEGYRSLSSLEKSTRNVT